MDYSARVKTLVTVTVTAADPVSVSYFIQGQ